MLNKIRQFKILCVSLLCLSFSVASATETENLGIHILPAPGKVVIDGKFDDWNLSGGIFAVNDVENLRDQYGVWLHVMYDADNLYILTRWNDPAPLNNPGSSKGDHGFAGDCLQLRFISAYNEKGRERVSHWTCWQDRDGVDVLDVVYNRDFKGKKIRDAQEQGAQQEFAINKDGKGYVQEIAIPWKLLTADGKPLQPGDEMRMALEPNYTAGAAAGRVSIKDIFLPGVKPDRVFTFRAYGTWGIAKLLKQAPKAPKPLRLADSREFTVNMVDGLPKVDWTGLIAAKELTGFKPIRFTMPVDGYVSLNILDATGAVVCHLLNWQFYAKGEHEVKWDGLGEKYFRTPGEPVPAGEYTWKAIAHPGIGLRLRGWASNAGNPPWDDGKTSNWGGDHGAPSACATDGKKVYLGWSGSEAGKALVACDLEGNVQWKHIHGGMGGADMVGVDGGTVFVFSGLSKEIYRLDSKTGSYQNWQDSKTSASKVSDLWKNNAASVGMPNRIEGMDADSGNLYVTCAAPQFRRSDVVDWKAFLSLIIRGDGLAATIREQLNDHWKKRRIPHWGENGPADLNNFCRNPNYYTPDFRDNVVNVMNKMLSKTALTPKDKAYRGKQLGQANRRFIEKQFKAHFIPMRNNFLAVLEGATSKPKKYIDIPIPTAVHAVRADLVYVIANDGTSVVAVNPVDGSTKTIIKGLQNARGVTVDANDNIYVSVEEPLQQILAHTKDGKLLRTIGDKGGRPVLGPWVKTGVRNPRGMVVDKEGKLWVAENTQTPQRISLWNVKEGKLLKELFGPTHYGASGGAINPRDPNIMAGEGTEWRIDPKTGRAVCLGSFDKNYHYSALYAEGANGKLYLVTSGSYKKPTNLVIRERLGDGNFAVRGSIRVKGKVTIFWADANGDGVVQDSETAEYPAPLRLNGYLNWSQNINTDLTLYADAKEKGLVFKVKDFTASGAPRYDVANPAQLPKIGGAMPTPDNKRVLSVDGKWFNCYDTASGRLLWKYPNTFSGVHGSHRAPQPLPGLTRGAFGIVGNAKLPKPLGGLWAVNGNCGEWYMFTEDGFFLTQLFQGDPFKMKFPEQAVPGAILDACPPGLGGEDFGGSMRQGKDGELYIQAGKTALWNVHVVGLDKVKALPGGKIAISKKDLLNAAKFREQQLQAVAGSQEYTASKATIKFTGNLNADFKPARPIKFAKQADARVRVAAAWDDTNLYLGWEVMDTTPWVNGADAPEYLYARGDTVDFQLGTDKNADAKRKEAVKGDFRLSIGNLAGKPTAVIYRKVSDEKKPKVFSSGVVKAEKMDYVNVLKAAKISVKKDEVRKRYVVEAAIPLAALGLKITNDLVLRGDFGATHGDKTGLDTALRTHWNNQQTGLVNDEVFELRMEPQNWGNIRFK